MKIVLVDDEKGIVDGLTKMIGRYLPECKVVGAAYNGAEGFRSVQQWRPDIVITDIRMPKEDGLDMIKRLKEAGSQTKFILLSGYADFEYARRGMQLGVQFYINKPVEEEELRDCVHRVMEAIREDRVKRQEVDELKQEVRSRIQEEALRNIIELGNEQTSDLAEELIRSAGIPTKDTRFASVLIELDGSVESLKETGLQPLYRLMDEALCRYKQVYRFHYSGTQIAAVVAHHGPIRCEELISSIHRLKEAAYREFKLSMTVGIGTAHNRATGIGQSFEEAQTALSYKVIKGTDAVIPFSDIRSAERRHPVPESLIGALQNGLEELNEAECDRVIREIFRRLGTEPGMSPAELQLQCLTILLSSARTLSFEQLQQNDFLGRHILTLEGISRFRTLDSLENWMIQVMRGILAFKREHHIPKKKNLIAEIKEYVSKHYQESITLADLAARFYLSPIYLSQLFKQKTGDTYLSYVVQVRIDRAKELLENTDLKVYEICQKVGYSDTQHFARLFERLTGSKPSEYRKMAQEGKRV